MSTRGPEDSCGGERNGHAGPDFTVPGQSDTAHFAVDDERAPLQPSPEFRQAEALCVQFEQAWSRPVLEEYLSRAAPEDRPRLLEDLLLIELYSRHLAGGRPDPAEYASRFPDDPELLAWCFTESWVAQELATVGPTCDAGPPPRFIDLRPHKKGGLGAVFEAFDSELKREVALKQILDDKADDPASRQRFLLEAEITSRLEHPGIVPVYSLSHHKDGRPYYAMRFFRDGTLKEAITDFHTDVSLQNEPGRWSLELRKLLRRLQDVCNAIDYAHGRGVLHRDIKPSNIIVGKHGETLVIDWGLAKATGCGEPGPDNGEVPIVPSSAAGGVETLPGSILGTPAYMSPEQFSGDSERLSPRSDVYSLGATFYHLLTGRPPFDGKVDEVKSRVMDGKFTRPWTLNPKIDKALEAVCLKAMAKDPADRYDSARGLAEDLERWMADQPVTAYRDPWHARMARRGRRHPKLVATMATIPTMLAISLLAGFVLVKAEKDRTQAAATEAMRQERIAKDNFELALEAVGRYDSDDLQESQFLRGQAEFHAKLGVRLEEQTDAWGKGDFRLQRALAHSEIGHAERAIKYDEFKTAAAFLGGARGRLERLPEPEPHDRYMLAEVQHDLSWMYGIERRFKESEAASRAALAILGQLADDYPREAQYRFYRAAELMDLGNTLRASQNGRYLGYGFFGLGDRTEFGIDYRSRGGATPEIELTWGGRSRPPTGGPEPRPPDMTRVLEGREKHLEARRELERLIAEHRPVVDSSETLIEYKNLMCKILLNISLGHEMLGNMGKAREGYLAAIGLCEGLIAQRPDVPSHRIDLVKLLMNLADDEQTDEAERLLTRASEMAVRMAEKYRNGPSYRMLAARVLLNLGYLYRRGDGPDYARKSEDCYRAARNQLSLLSVEHPEHIECQKMLVIADEQESFLHWRTGQREDARECFDRSIQQLELLAAEFPKDWEFRDRLANRYKNLGLFYAEGCRTEAARSAYEAAREHYTRLLADAERMPEGRLERDERANLRDRLADTNWHLGHAYLKLGRHADARAAWTTAREFIVAGGKTSPSRSLLDAIQYFLNDLIFRDPFAH